ncbi:lactococcin 972 family bacteriocin [Microbacterium sp.]|jgi:hypothetical protein|uniref:lactococcin 972 family bacteriocin n=1 Tax=Microbacterium sp. TaxID=51671 RepID=UPI0035AFFFF3
MRKVIKAILTGGAATALVIAGAGTAAAHNNGYGAAPNHYASNTYLTGAAVGGGRMYYGVHEMINGTDRNNDSSYYHGTKQHRASVKNSTGAVVRSGDKAGGIWAQATQDATAFGNQAYWYTY